MLKESEWNTINNILLELYTIDEITVLSKKVLNVLRILIPFTKGYFLLLDDDQKIDVPESFFLGMNEESVSRYINKYYDKDYLQYLYDFSQETTVYQDSSILEDEIRKNTEFYKNFLLPADIPYGCGILIIKNHSVTGVFNLFRNEALGDFSEKDIYILNVLKKHLENIIHNAKKLSRQQVAISKCFELSSEKFGLSDRENEILHLIADGKSNNDICETLNVSLSTVKKHVYNIFNKAGVNSRAQLLNLIYSLND